MNIDLKITDTTDVTFPIFTKDKKGNVIHCQLENNYYFERTYDDNGNRLTYKNSNGYWDEYTYDDNGNQLTSKSSNGNYRIKFKEVTKEEYEAFLNGTPEYTIQ